MRVECNHFLIPFDMYEAIKSHMIRLDYDYIANGRVWKLHGESKIPAHAMHVNDLTAMQVAKKLES